MDQDNIKIEENAFPSALIRTAAWLCAVTALLGLVGAAALLNPDYRAYLLRDLFASGITAESSLRGYFTVRSVVVIVVPIWTGLLAVCLMAIYYRKSFRGWSAIATVTRRAVWLLNAVGICLICLYIYRFVRYTVACMGERDGLHPFLAMAVSEVPLGILVCWLFLQFRKFLNGLSESAVSIAYTMSAGTLDSVSIPACAATGFLILGILSAIYAVGEMFTVTVAYDGIRAYYKLLVSGRPEQIITVAALVFNSGSSFVLYQYLRRYKQISERLLYENRKRILNMQ